MSQFYNSKEILGYYVSVDSKNEMLPLWCILHLSVEHAIWQIAITYKHNTTHSAHQTGAYRQLMQQHADIMMTKLTYWGECNHHHCYHPTARSMGPTWGPSGVDRTQVGPMLAPWILLSGYYLQVFSSYTPARKCIQKYIFVKASVKKMYDFSTEMLTLHSVCSQYAVL